MFSSGTWGIQYTWNMSGLHRDRECGGSVQKSVLRRNYFGDIPKIAVLFFGGGQEEVVLYWLLHLLFPFSWSWRKPETKFHSELLVLFCAVNKLLLWGDWELSISGEGVWRLLKKLRVGQRPAAECGGPREWREGRQLECCVVGAFYLSNWRLIAFVPTM